MNKNILLLLSVLLIISGCSKNITNTSESNTRIESSGSTSTLEMTDPTNSQQIETSSTEFEGTEELDHSTIAALVAQYEEMEEISSLGFSFNNDIYVLNQGESPYSVQFTVAEDTISILNESRIDPGNQLSIRQLIDNFYSNDTKKDKTLSIEQKMINNNQERGE